MIVMAESVPRAHELPRTPGRPVCAVPGCDQEREGRRMCRGCWERVPADLQQRVVRALRERDHAYHGRLLAQAIEAAALQGRLL